MRELRVTHLKLAHQYLERAEETRVLMEDMRDPKTRVMLERIAEGYLYMANNQLKMADREPI